MQEFIAKLPSAFKIWRIPWSGENEDGNQGTLSFIIRIGSVLFLYLLLDRILIRLTYLPIESYYNSSIFVSFVNRIFFSWLMIPSVALGVIAVIFWNKLGIKWGSLSGGRSVRVLVTATAGILTWVYATYNYNLYFDQGHYLDRLLLFVCLALVYWRPVFVLPFLTTLLSITWQFFALQGHSLTPSFPLIRILILFQCFFFIYLLTKKFITADFVFLVGCLMAAHYWTSGYEKLSLDWLLYDQINYMLSSRYTHGWMKFFSPQTISSITGILGNFNFPVKIFTLFVEFGAFLFFVQRRMPLIFLIGWIAFHIGIVLTSGFFFWMWILLEITLLWLFLRKDGFSNLPLFSKKHIVISIILIITGAYWCRPGTLAWFDIPVDYAFRLEAEDIDGEKYSLPPNFFAPYDYQFSLSVFRYLDPEPKIPSTWGTSDSSKVALKIMDLESAEEVFEYEKIEGKIYFNLDHRKKFDAFVKQYIRNWNKRYSNKTYLTYLQPPRLILTYPAEAKSKPGKAIKSVTVVHVTSFYNKGQYREIRNNPIYTILIQ